MRRLVVSLLFLYLATARRIHQIFAGYKVEADDHLDTTHAAPKGSTARAPSSNLVQPARSASQAFSPTPQLRIADNATSLPEPNEAASATEHEPKLPEATPASPGLAGAEASLVELKPLGHCQTFSQLTWVVFSAQGFLIVVLAALWLRSIQPKMLSPLAEAEFNGGRNSASWEHVSYWKHVPGDDEVAACHVVRRLMEEDIVDGKREDLQRLLEFIQDSENRIRTFLLEQEMGQTDYCGDRYSVQVLDTTQSEGTASCVSVGWDDAMKFQRTKVSENQKSAYFSRFSRRSAWSNASSVFSGVSDSHVVWNPRCTTYTSVSSDASPGADAPPMEPETKRWMEAFTTDHSEAGAGRGTILSFREHFEALMKKQDSFKLLRKSGDALTAVLARLDQWDDFDVDDVQKLSGKCLNVVTSEALQRRGLFERFGVSPKTMRCYLQKIEGHHRAESFQNARQAADAVHAMHLLVNNRIPHLSEVEVLGCLVAVAVHDVGHPGVSNSFRVRSSDDDAVTFSDRSVNEHMHFALAWRLMSSSEDTNWIKPLSTEQAHQLKVQIFEMTIRSDPSRRIEALAKFQEEILDRGDEVSQWPNAMPALELLVQACDVVSTTARQPWKCLAAVERYMSELFAQGDRERELFGDATPLSPLCDRQLSTALTVADAQLHFVFLVAAPSFMALRVLGDVEDPQVNVQKMCEHWETERQSATAALSTSRKLGGNGKASTQVIQEDDEDLDFVPTPVLVRVLSTVSEGSESMMSHAFSRVATNGKKRSFNEKLLRQSVESQLSPRREMDRPAQSTAEKEVVSATDRSPQSSPGSGPSKSPASPRTPKAARTEDRCSGD